MAIGWIRVGNVSEFLGNFWANFLVHRARTKTRFTGSTKADEAINAYNAINKGLKENCLPLDDHILKSGLKQTCRALKNNDHFGAQVAIDANPGPRKRDICIALIKIVVTYLCSESPSDLVRSATYTMLACDK